MVERARNKAGVVRYVNYCKDLLVVSFLLSHFRKQAMMSRGGRTRTSTRKDSFFVCRVCRRRDYFVRCHFSRADFVPPSESWKLVTDGSPSPLPGAPP